MADVATYSTHKGPVDEHTLREMLKKQGINNLDDLVKKGVEAAKARQAGGPHPDLSWWGLIGPKFVLVGSD